MNSIHKRRLIITLGLASLIFVVSYAGMRISTTKKNLEKKIIIETNHDVNQPLDTLKLALFKQVYDQLSPNKKTFAISGALTINDGADTSVHVQRIPYEYLKDDKRFYYQLGQTETLNGDGLYIYVDHLQKKIMIDQQKEIDQVAILPSIDKIASELSDEGYEVVETATSKPGQQKIALVAPTHISCKEFALFFDQKTMKPTSILTRLSNFSDPLNSKMDRVMIMTVVATSNEVGNEKFSSKRIIIKNGENDYSPTSTYAGYELIYMR